MTLGPAGSEGGTREWGHEQDRPRMLSRAASLAMCIAFPGRVIAFDDRTAVVDVGGRTRRASLLITPEVEVGEWVLVAAGAVVRRIDADEALDLATRLEAAMVATALPARPTSPSARYRRFQMNARWSVRIPDTLRWGVLLALGTAAISGVSIFVNASAVKQLPDPALYTTLKNGIAGLVLIGLALATIRPASVRAVPARSWGWLAVVGIVGGSVPFLLFFTGLAQASAPSAAFIHKTLFVWVALLAVPLLGERLGWAQLGALAVLLVAQLLIVPPNGVTWGTGETMIAIATLLWAIETIVARRLLSSVPAAVVGAGRLGIGLLVLVGYLAATGKLAMVATLTPEQWGWALLTGLLLSGYVGTWFAALQRAPASLVTAVLVLGAPVTATLVALQNGAFPAPPALIGQALILVAGGMLLVPMLRRWQTAPITVDAAA
jgi:hydrogenase assembly chaperone HypC/HupF